MIQKTDIEVSCEDKKNKANYYSYQKKYYDTNAEYLRKTARERSKMRYDNDIEFKELKKEKMRELAKIRLQNPEYKARHNNLMKERYRNDTEYRVRIQTNALNRARNPEIKEQSNQRKRLEYAIGKDNADLINTIIH